MSWSLADAHTADRERFRVRFFDKITWWVQLKIVNDTLKLLNEIIFFF